MYTGYEWEDRRALMESSIDTFIDECSFREFFNRVREDIIGQDEELIKACYNVYRYMEGLANGRKTKSNFIISAPSGSGKTEFYRSVKKIINDVYRCKIPIVQIDMSSFTEVGYKGRNVSEILKELVCSGSQCGEGIVFLDEFDKKLIHSVTGDGVNLNGGVQNGLLAMIEGYKYSASKIDDFELIKGGNRKFDTGKTLFIGLGAFQACREKKVKDDEKISLGFAIQKETEKIDIYTDIDYQDILDFGCCAELLGRFSQVVNFHKLSDEAYARILKEYVSKLDYLPCGCRVMVTNEGADDFLQFANSEMGIREMKRRLDATIQPNIIKMMLDGERKEGTCIIVNGYLKTEETAYHTGESQENEDDNSEYVYKKGLKPVRKADGCPFE